MIAEPAHLTRGWFRPSPFVLDLVNTAITSLLMMAALVLVTRWLAVAFSTEEFGVYGFSRRLVSSIAIYSLVAGMTVTRYLAISKSLAQRYTYLLAATVFAVLPALLLLGLASIAPAFWARIVFHDASLGAALLSTLLLVVATATVNLLCAYYRGAGRVRQANYWQLWGVGLGPLVIAFFWAYTRSLALINTLTAAIMFLSLIPLGAELVRASAGRESGKFRIRLGELLQYGLPRVPGGFFFGGMMAVGPFFAPRFGTMTDAGFLVAGQLLLRTVELGTSAFGVLALPRIAELQAQGRQAFIRDRVEDIVAMTCHLGSFATLQLLLWTDVIVRAWLGERYLPGTPIIRIVLVAAVPYLGYTMLRAVIDALDERAMNTRNMLWALCITLAASVVLGLAGLGGLGLAIAGTLGLLVLGVLSVWHLWRTLALSRDALLLGPGLALTALVAAATVGSRMLLPPTWPPLGSLAFAGGAAGTLGVLYLLSLRHFGARWIRELEGRLIRPPGAKA
jgi:O-antigen/teichoic acid export membrane protein